MLRRVTLVILLFGVFIALTAYAQSSRRRPDPGPPSSPNVFDQLEKQIESRENQRARLAALRERQRAELAELGQELPQLINLAQELEGRLNSTDFDSVLPADLRQQGEELERLARQIHKRIRSL